MKDVVSWEMKNITVCDLCQENCCAFIHLMLRLDLDTVATHPDYQRRGCGSMLVQWGCKLADENSVGAYVDASKDGAPLYEKCGFVDESEPGSGDIASMARRQNSLGDQRSH